MQKTDLQTLLRVVHTMEQKYTRVETLRELAGSEETYLLIMREIDRVKDQVARARALGVAATLNVIDWFTILDRYAWKCAYCQSGPFQVMSHQIPQAVGGTTPENCVPACHRCIFKRRTRTQTLRTPRASA